MVIERKSVQERDILNNYKLSAPKLVPPNNSPPTKIVNLSKVTLDTEYEKLKKTFIESFEEDKFFTLKLLFYFLDYSVGRGDYKLFQRILSMPWGQYEKDRKRLLNSESFWSLVEHYGTWAVVFRIAFPLIEKSFIKNNKEPVLDTQVSFDGVVLFRLVSKVLHEDLDKKEPSLLTKWLPSEKKSLAKNYPRTYKALLSHLKMRDVEYRKVLSSLRKRIGIVETTLCKKQWDQVDYKSLPVKALLTYDKTFKQKDKKRYLAYKRDRYLAYEREKRIKGQESLSTRKPIRNISDLVTIVRMSKTYRKIEELLSIIND